MESTELADIRSRAEADPLDVTAQITAAYACDSKGLETDAVVYYDRAWRLGVPVHDRHDFLIGYGSTLRNVDRLEDSMQILGIAATEFENDLAPNAFLALTLNSAGRPDEAVALLLESLVASDGPGIARFARAINSYAGLLRE